MADPFDTAPAAGEDPTGRTRRGDGVVVFGMHRSGTSALTGLLTGCGLNPGPLDMLLGPTEANPYGHFEPEPLQSFNDGLLNHLERYWHCPPTRVEIFSIQDFDPVRVDLATVFDAVYEAPGWVYKDPRLCVMWHLYVPLFDPAPVGMFMARHPMHVARSLERRDGIPVEHGLALWDFYCRSALSALARCRNPQVLLYDDMIADPDAMATRLVAVLDEAAVAPTGSLGGPDSAIDPTLNRSARGDDTEIPAEAAALWEEIRAMADTGSPAPVPPPSDQVIRRIDRRAALVREHIERADRRIGTTRGPRPLATVAVSSETLTASDASLRFRPIVGTLAYLLDRERDAVLMIRRNARPDDDHYGKVNGLGGKVEPDEDIVASLRREIDEETGLTITAMALRGTITWTNFGPKREQWLGFVFLVDGWTGTPPAGNDEGSLEWIERSRLLAACSPDAGIRAGADLPMWAGDRHFVPLVFDDDPRAFHGTMPYDADTPTAWRYERL